MTCASLWSNRWRAALWASACLTALPANAAFLEGEALDSVASAMALIVIFIVPIVGITLFWIVHVLPEKIAHKRHHPQRDAIHMLCLLSLVFGGLLWPLAFLWAYSKPVLHKLAYGTDKHEDFYVEHANAPAKTASLQTEVAALRGNVERMLATGGTPQELAALRDQLAALEPRVAAQAGALTTSARESH
jgi:Protein of unknown function (DUF3302)